MVVDDSIVIRGLISRWLSALPDIEVVASCRNGQEAVDTVAKCRADVAILDIEMPVMDGLTALPAMLKAAPGVKVLMASTLTRRNAGISIQALQKGATDYVPKPESMRGGHASGDFQNELIEKVRVLGLKRMRETGRKPVAVSAGVTAAVRESAPSLLSPAGPLSYQAASRVPPRIVAIGSSTGGPKALFELFKGLSPALDRVPTVITQHMPPTFTSILAEHITSVAKRPCVEGETGMVLQPGKIYIAPGGFHMLLEQKGSDVVIKLSDSAPVNFCRPAVDPMLDSLIPIYGAAILVCILTGMGHDGRDGSKHVQAKGGTILAQDEASSVVWGMPGAVATAGICHKVLPLDRLPAAMTALIKGGAA